VSGPTTPPGGSLEPHFRRVFELAVTLGINLAVERGELRTLVDDTATVAAPDGTPERWRFTFDVYREAP
jgi:hypothetical protein